MGAARTLWTLYRLRWKRRRLLFRALRKRRQLTAVVDRTSAIRPDAILCFSTVRNETVRLPYFLDHHRRLGVDHFLIVDNASDDGTADYLAAQPDVSVWSTGASYRLSRFGVDWLTWLQCRYAHGHWCLTLDADEILIYPHHDTRPLGALTEWLDEAGRPSFGALMLDLYPKGRLGDRTYEAGQDPIEFDPLVRPRKLHPEKGSGPAQPCDPGRGPDAPVLRRRAAPRADDVEDAAGPLGPPLRLCQFDPLAVAPPPEPGL